MGLRLGGRRRSHPADPGHVARCPACRVAGHRRRQDAVVRTYGTGGGLFL